MVNREFEDRVKKVRLGLPHVIIGKGGCEAVVEEFKRQIKKHKVIKVKLLRSVLMEDKEELSRKLAEMTGSELVEIRGRQLIYKKVDASHDKI